MGLFLEHLVTDGASWTQVLKSVPFKADFWVMRERGREDRFPWEILDHGIDRNFLWDEYQRALHGLPSPPSLTTTWSMVSGPGIVTFQNPNAVDTQASFSIAGTYVLWLRASDGALGTSDVTQITVYPAGTILRRIAVGPDDAEESAAGNVSRSNNDLELLFSGSGH